MSMRGYTIFSLIVLLLSAFTSQTTTPTPTPPPSQVPEPTVSPSPTAVPTLVALPDGDFIYGDPDDRFSLPLIGDWTPIETMALTPTSSSLTLP